MQSLGVEVIDEMPDKPLSLKELLSNPAILSLCTSGFALCFLNTGFQVIFVLFSYTSILNGGLGLSVCAIIDIKAIIRLTSM